MNLTVINFHVKIVSNKEKDEMRTFNIKGGVNHGKQK